MVNFILNNENFYNVKLNRYIMKTQALRLSGPVRIVFLTILLAIITSCSTYKDVIQWNVELKESKLPITNQCNPDEKLTSIKSAEQPKLIPETETREARIQVSGMPCGPNQEPPLYEIPVSRVKRITYVSDPLQPPQEISTGDLMTIEGCCRERNGWWIFDKFEIKAAIGYRGSQDSVVYTTPAGQETYYSSAFGFDRGGSSFVLGLEADGLWDLTFLDDSKRLQGGILVGVWPVDEAIFIPVGLNVRYTFNQYPDKYSNNCNSFYLYGNAGLPFDFQSGAPVFGNAWEFQRFFAGGGFGYDIAISCTTDLSIDLGYRFMNLPLPEIECCPDVPDGERNPFRASDVLLLRFGLTF